MSALIAGLSEYFAYPFARYALIVGVLVALCSALLGVTLVLKRFSFIGDGLSHVAFGAMSVAAVVGLTDQMLLVLPVTIVCAVLLLRTGQNAKLKGDASVAIISVTALAVGYLLMNVFPPSSGAPSDVCGTLFGSQTIWNLSSLDVWLSIALSLVTVAVFVIFYNRIFAVTFDENFAKATGVKTDIYNLIIAVVIAVVIVLAMNLVGSLLVSALIIFPALSAMRVFKSFLSVTICSTILSVTTAFIGILASVLLDTPVGPTIVAVEAIVFGVFWIIGACKGVRRA